MKTFFITKNAKNTSSYSSQKKLSKHFLFMDPDPIKVTLDNLKKLNERVSTRQKNYRDFVFRHTLSQIGKIICSSVKILTKEEPLTDDHLETLADIETIINRYLELGDQLHTQTNNWVKSVVIDHGQDIIYYPHELFSLRDRFQNCLSCFSGEKYNISDQTTEDDSSQASDFKQLLKYLQNYTKNNEDYKNEIRTTIEKIMKEDLYMTKEQAEQIRESLDAIKDINITDDDISIHQEQLGSGGFGTVMKGTYLKTSEEVAVKTIRMDRVSSSSTYSFIVEIQLMNRIRDQYILKLVGAHTKFPFRIITRYCAGKSLYERLHKKTDLPNLTNHDLTKIAYQVALGMKYLHDEQKIVHRDLKTLNILLDEHANACVADLGLSTENSGNQKISGGAGTFNYTAPEILAHIHYTRQVDVYSYAMVLWEMLLRKVPFGDMKQEDIYNHVVRNNWRLALPQDAPIGLVRLITQAWSKNPKDRPTFSQIVEMFRKGLISFEERPNQDDLKKIEGEKHCPNLNKEYLIRVLQKDEKYLQYFDSVVEFIVANMDSQIQELLRKNCILKKLIETPEDKYSSTLLLASAAFSNDEEFKWFLEGNGKRMFINALNEHSQQSLNAALIFATKVPIQFIGIIESYVETIVGLLDDTQPISNGIVLQILTRFTSASRDKYKDRISEVLLSLDPSAIVSDAMFKSFSQLILDYFPSIKAKVLEAQDPTKYCKHFASFISGDYEVNSNFVNYIIGLFTSTAEMKKKTIPDLIKSILRALKKSDLTQILIRMVERLFDQSQLNSSQQAKLDCDQQVFEQLSNDQEIIDLICQRLSDKSTTFSLIGPLFLLFSLVRFDKISTETKHRITKTLLDVPSYTPQKLQIFTALSSSEEYCRTEDDATINSIIRLLSSSQTNQGQHLSTTALRLILAMSSHREGCEILETHDVFDLFRQNFLASYNPVDMVISYNIIRNAISNDIQMDDYQIIVKFLLQSLLYEMSQKETILDTLVAIAKTEPKCINEKDLQDYILFKLEAPKVVLQGLRLLKALSFEDFSSNILGSILIHINQILGKSNYFHPKIIASCLGIISKIIDMKKLDLKNFFAKTNIIEYAKEVLKMVTNDDKRKTKIQLFIAKIENTNCASPLPFS